MRKAKIDLQKHTLLLYQGDFAKLGEYYPDHGATVALRELVHKHLERLDGAAQAPENVIVKGKL